MKHIKIGMFLSIAFMLITQSLLAQNTVDIKAIVQQIGGQPVAGAMITCESSTEKAYTNENGEFSLKTKSGAVLTVVAVGYETKRVAASIDLKLIEMRVEQALVNVALRQVKKTDLMNDVSSVNVPEILEKNYNTYSLDNLMSYVPGFTGNIWGNGSFLVVVDGVPRDANNVLPTEIDQITVLKGVSAVALYGSQAARGAIVITTKRGTVNTDYIKVRANTGLHAPKAYPKYLGSADYMELFNEARQNDGLSPLFNGSTPETTIDNYRSGRNPYRFPDIDYYSSDYLRKVSNRSDVTAEFVGGNERARYYANMGLSSSNSLLNVGEGANDVTTRMNVRGNLDIKINDFITSKINATMVFYDQKGAQGGYWNNAANLRPNRYTPFIPLSYLKGQDEAGQKLLDEFVASSSFLIDDKYLIGGNMNHQTHPFAEMLTKGSSTYSSRNFQFDAGVDINMNSVLKGLSFSSQFGVDYMSSFNLSVNNNSYAVYTPTWWEDAEGNEFIGALTKINQDKVSRSRGLSNSYLRQNTFFTGSFNYNNTFDDVHNVSAVLNGRAALESISMVYQDNIASNLGLHVGYNYAQKYYADFSGNMVYSTRFAPGASRRGFSPTMSLAWRVTGEDFLADSDVVNDLKLTASAGVVNTDLDFSSYYLFSEIYQRTGWNSWQEGRSRNGTYLVRGGNADLTFVKRKEINVGFDASLLDNKLQVTANYFNSTMDGIPVQSTTIYPSYFSYSSTNMVPFSNFNADLRTGIDFGVNYKTRIGNVDVMAGVNGLYFETKALKRNESVEFENQKRTGRPIDGIYGMRSLGIYQNQQEIDDRGLTHSLGAVKPGDLKYVDITGDGIIDGKDIEYLGRWNSPFSVGMHVTLKWNNFTLFMLANGRYGGYAMKNNSYQWIFGERKYSEVALGRSILGTDDNGQLYVTNPETATYPRLTSTTSDNNFRDSDYWMYKTDRFNLTKVQLSYDLPNELFRNSILSGAGFYVSGSDLLVIAKERKLMEMNIGGSPQTRFFNLGFKAQF